MIRTGCRAGVDTLTSPTENTQLMYVACRTFFFFFFFCVRQDFLYVCFVFYLQRKLLVFTRLPPLLRPPAVPQRRIGDASGSAAADARPRRRPAAL